MEATLTARDKKLLYILGFIVILFVFGWLLMRPVIRSIMSADEDIVTAQALKQQNDDKVMGLISARSLVDKFEEDLATATEEYYAPMNSSEIDKMMTTYVLGYGLTAKDLTISMPSSALDEMPYKYSEAGKRLQEREKSSSSDTSGSGKETSESTAEGISAEEPSLLLSFTQTPFDAYSEKKMVVKDTTASGTTCADVTFVLTGPREKAQKLLDDILVKPSTRVTYFAWDELPPVVETQEDGSVLVKDNEDVQLTLRLRLYMYDSEKAGIEAPRKKD